jgi:isopentenyldiphosphate isomerase
VEEDEKTYLHTEVEFAQGLVDHVMNHTPEFLHRPFSDFIFGEIVDIVVTERWVSRDLGGGSKREVREGVRVDAGRT